MDVSLVLVFLAALLIGTTLLKKKRRLPPTRFSIPYIGTPVVLAKVAGRHPHEVFAEEAKNLGDIFSFQLANKLIVVLNKYDAVYEAFVKNGTSCSGRVVEFNKMLKIDGDERGKIFCEPRNRKILQTNDGNIDAQSLKNIALYMYKVFLLLMYANIDSFSGSMIVLYSFQKH